MYFDELSSIQNYTYGSPPFFSLFKFVITSSAIDDNFIVNDKQIIIYFKFEILDYYF